MSKANDRQRLAWEGMFYSIQRIDLLIVSICGAGIYVCLETIKYLSDKNLQIHYLVKLSGGLFLLGIIANFLSQLFGHKANEQDFLMCDAEIDAGEKVSEAEKKEIEGYDQAAERYSKKTNRLNSASMILMFCGLGAIMVYFLFIF